MSEDKVHKALERLIAGRFVEACEGFQRNRLYRITAAGLKHPQRGQATVTHQRHTSRLNPTYCKVLSAILDSGSLRIEARCGDL